MRLESNTLIDVGEDENGDVGRRQRVYGGIRDPVGGELSE
jgi:hypothetical protein